MVLKQLLEHQHWTVTPVNDAPVVNDLTYILNEDFRFDFSDTHLLSQASDVDGDNLLGDGEVSFSGTDGVLTMNPEGSV